MIFNSIEFIIFIVFVLSLYYLLPQKYKSVFLLASSIVFYAFNGINNLIILFLYLLIAYIGGILINKNNNKKAILSVCILILLIGLIYTKYINLFISIINELFDSNISTILLIAPAGISFYTFQIISYLIDVYRKRIECEYNLITLSIYISFFPKILVGPIERYENIKKQINMAKNINWHIVFKGLFFTLWGFFLKLVIADRANILVNTVLGDLDQFSGFYIVFAVMMYSFQIYCDFLGYTYIALGVAKLLGFELTDNFNSPYLSLSLSDFWRRWHITLNLWFKDYLYIPLGGNRKGKVREYLNKLIIFILSGLWHGPTIGFVLWGLLNGIYIIVENIMKPLQLKIESKFHINAESKIYKSVSIIRTFILISFSWIFFRSNTFTEAINIIKSMFLLNNINVLIDGSLLKLEVGLGTKNTLLLIATIILLLFVDYLKKKNISIIDIIMKQNVFVKSVVIAILCLSILLFGKYGFNINMSSFIYQRF